MRVATRKSPVTWPFIIFFGMLLVLDDCHSSILINDTSDQPTPSTQSTESCQFTQSTQPPMNITLPTQSTQPPRNLSDLVLTLSINATSTEYVVGPTFLSLALSATKVGTFCNLVSSSVAKNIARSLSPADLRVGGTNSHHITFDPSITNCSYRMTSLHMNKTIGNLPNLQQVGLTGPQMEALGNFLTEVNWGLLYNLNFFKFRPDGLWDSTNVESMLNDTSARGVQIAGFHLGNEPNAYRHKFNYNLNPKVLTEDYQLLKSLLSKYPLYNTSKLYGPDVTDLRTVSNSRNILRGFLASGSDQIIDGISIHHYYSNGRIANISSFLDVNAMNDYKRTLEVAHTIITQNSSRPLSIHLTETSSCYGGGAAGYSDRYVSGFLWLDKLGVSALYGVSRVFRQTIWGGAYEIVSYSFDAPKPDYYLSVLYKKLVRGPVLDVRVTPSDSKLRVYANCAHNLWYEPGAVVFYYLNLDTENRTVSIPLIGNRSVELYILTPGDGKGLTSESVKLNGEVLQVTPTGVFPAVFAQETNGNLTLPAQTFGFIVLPDAEEPTCVRYFINNPEEAQANPEEKINISIET